MPDPSSKNISFPLVSSGTRGFHAGGSKLALAGAFRWLRLPISDAKLS
jgi:hypothetical protein